VYVLERVFILDTGAFLSNWTQKHPSAVFITTEHILNEIQNSPSKMRAENLISVGRLQVESVGNEFISKVSQAATKTGDVKVLSENDIEILALTLSKLQTGLIVTLVSSDFAVLNTANFLEIDFFDLTGKMKRAITWILECPACKYRGSKGLECPVCGTRMRRRAQKKKTLS
jgi:UPF0271 protein